MAFTLQPAVKDDFVDREDILADMLSTLKDKSIRMGFALVGSRRIGKTSILKEVVRRLEGEKDVSYPITQANMSTEIETNLPSFDEFVKSPQARHPRESGGP